MAKVSEQEVIDLGFTPEMFRKSDEGLTTLVAEIIEERASHLLGRLGSSYDSSNTTIQESVKRAEKCLVAGELLERRINIILGNVHGAGEEISTKNEEKQRGRYLAEAEKLIQKIVEGITTDSSDFAMGVLQSSHFDEDTETSALSGLNRPKCWTFR